MPNSAAIGPKRASHESARCEFMYAACASPSSFIELPERTRCSVGMKTKPSKSKRVPRTICKWKTTTQSKKTSGLPYLPKPPAFAHLTLPAAW